MPAVTLPFNIQNGDPLDADKVMANDQTITSAMNGGLDTSNALTDVPVSQPGNTAAEGTSASFMRADATFVIQGVEKLAALPTTGNFIGRCVVRTSDSKLYYCTDATGTGTFIVIGNQAAIDVPVHAAQHADGQHDPLPDLILTDHMKAARTILTATQAADVNNISAASYTTIVDLVLGAATLAQTLAISASVMAQNGAASARKVCLRLQDITAATTVWRSKPWNIAATTGADQVDISETIYYTLPASGARTLRLQAGADGATVNIVKSLTFNGDSTVPANLLAVVI